VVAFAALALAGFGAGIAFGIGETTATVTQTVTQTVTVSGTTLGTKLAARMPESSVAHTTIVSPGANLNSTLASAVDGDVIQLHGGNYGPQSINGKNFSALNPVTITDFPGETPIMVGRSSGTGSANALYVGTSSGIRIRGLTFDAKVDTVELKIESSNDIEADGNTFRTAGANNSLAGTGILLGSGTGFVSNIQIWNNTIFKWGLNAAGTNQQHGIYAADGSNMTIANNLIYDGPQGYGIQAGPAVSNSIFTNNTIDGVVKLSGMVVWTGTSGGSEPTNGNLIVNNIFSNNGGYAIFGCGGPVPATPNIVRSNLSFNNTSGDYNPIGCILSGNATFTVESPGFTGDPLYVNRSARDYHLQAGSPALRKADPEYAPLMDKDGKARPTSPALGAYN
jgi:hypothetical protein